MPLDKNSSRGETSTKNYAELMRRAQPARILVVDDDQDILDLLIFTLKQEGYKTQTALNGRDALRLVDEFSPDVMCIDYMMPEMNGQELARQIRARQDMLYVPIVMLTAVADQGAFKISSLESGVDAYISKPFARDELKSTIKTMLRIKMAQDNMLAALDRVAEVQDELLGYERQQGQYEAMHATIATYTHELNTPLTNASTAANGLESLLQVQTFSSFVVEAQTYLKQIKEAIDQANNTLRRLQEAEQFAVKEGTGHKVILDLDQVNN